MRGCVFRRGSVDGWWPASARSSRVSSLHTPPLHAQRNRSLGWVRVMVMVGVCVDVMS